MISIYGEITLLIRGNPKSERITQYWSSVDHLHNEINTEEDVHLDKYLSTLTYHQDD